MALLRNHRPTHLVNPGNLGLKNLRGIPGQTPAVQPINSQFQPSGSRFGPARGGTIVSGGSIGQRVAQHQFQRRVNKDMYHELIRMPQHQWERVREHAMQSMGSRASPMWGKVHAPKFGGGFHHMQKLAELHCPHLAAKQLEVEHAHTGESGGFSDALHHALRSAGHPAVGGGFFSDAFDVVKEKGIGIAKAGLSGCVQGGLAAGKEALSGVVQEGVSAARGGLDELQSGLGVAPASAQQEA